MKDLKIYLSIATVLLVIYLVAQYNRPAPINWSPTLKNDQKIPFGTYIAYQRLTDIFPHANVLPFREPVYNVLTDHDIHEGAYVIVCNMMKLTDDDYEQLSKYVESGNEVFISASDFSGVFKKKLNIETQVESKSSEKSGIHFLNPSLAIDSVFANDKFIDDSYFANIDTARVTVIAQNKYHDPVFLKVNVGKGALYLTCQPLVFSNYSLLNSKGAVLAGTMLSYLNNTKTVLWDEYYTQGPNNEGSLMRVFINSVALRWAFYIALASMFLFVLYETKRRQRIIPVIEPLSNTTVEFVNVVGQVYYEQRNNSNIAQKKAAYFLEYVRARYHLKTNALDSEFVEAIAHKSGVSNELVNELINQVIIAKSSYHINDSDLISLNQSIELFYTQSS